MPRKLLLADDSVTIQKVIEITFANQDFDLILAGNGDEALEKARKELPDIILADIIMPGKNGYELCRVVKQTPELAHIPILLLVGSFEPFDEEKARGIGADGWISKPFETQVLIGKVQALLENAPPPRALSEGVPAAMGDSDSVDELPEEKEDLSFSFDLDEVVAPTAAAADTPSEIEEQSLAAETPPISSAFSAKEDFAETVSENDLTLHETREEKPDSGPELFEKTLDFSPGGVAAATSDEKPEGGWEAGSDNGFFSETREEPRSFVADQEDDVAGSEESSAPSPFLGLEEESPLQEEVASYDSPSAEKAVEEKVLFLSEEDIIIEEDDAEDLPSGEIISSDEIRQEEESPAFTLVSEETLEEEPLDTEDASFELESDLVDDPHSEADRIMSEAVGAEPEAEAFEAEEELVLEIEEPLEEEVEFTFEPVAVEEPDALEEEPFAPEGVDEVSEFELEVDGPEESRTEMVSFVEEETEDSLVAAAPVSDQEDVDTVEQKIAAMNDDELYAIVERVAKERLDRMAAEILERIAWEVVPNMSESLIKEEIRKIKELRH